ncbi:NADH:flavin oxidoreductase [Acidaminobacter sp. JC074]|uniref:NADH:flavin oxidoreductase n=1 Tax=Acidaminobacter sp. JC074 TaxID=2530199 RepID=UPI001F0D2987|nr:NADH:flavin oxidoreductase [Acidaminobacter sp. JC074]MCH4887169.1 NADH:flavin oxidoreductase [Acidaminobacter sp. JC074]
MKLNSPIQIGKRVCKNRIVMPPLVCFNWADEEGLETVSREEHYGKRNATGLIVVEAAGISKESRIVDTELGIWDDKHIKQYERIAKACHKEDALVIVQIVHAGIKAYPDQVYTSSYKEALNKEVLELNQDQIETIKKHFVNSALLAKEAGLDGVEVHGAHGYLLSQFTSPQANHRSDAYGGSTENRYKLSLDIVKDIRQATGDDFIISYRFGVNDPFFEDDIKGIKLLEQAGVDVFNVSSGIGIKSLDIPSDYPESFITYMGYKMKEHTNKPVISVYGILRPEQAEYLIENDYTDMVAVGRGLLADPKWTEKALNKKEVNICFHCKRCQFVVDGHKCPQKS